MSIVNLLPRPALKETALTADPASAYLRLTDVTKTYRSLAGAVQALKGISLDVQQGEFIAVVGRSGAGKSTLVNMITGVDTPTSGEIWVFGTPVHQLRSDRLARWRGLGVGVVYQTFQLLPQLSLIDNVTLPMDLCGVYQPFASRERALALLDEVGLAEHANKPPTAISGGQQQRVAIARALANDPPLLVADEPTGNLDSTTAADVLELFEALVARGKTLFVVTHDETIARRATRVIHLLDGQIVDDSDSDDNN